MPCGYHVRVFTDFRHEALHIMAHRGVKQMQKVLRSFHAAKTVGIETWRLLNQQVEILRMWERDSHTVGLRWKLRCFPHLLSDKLVNLDGVSEYRFDEHGLIYQHTVDVVDLDGGRKRERQPQLHRSLSTLAC